MKNKIFGYIALAIGLVVFNVIVFAVPAEHDSAFWISYCFTDVTFLTQVFIWNRAFKNADAINSKFLGIPIAYVGALYLIAQIICFAAVIASDAPPGTSVIANIAVLGIACLLFVSEEISRNVINNVEQKVTENTAFIKVLRVKVASLIADEGNPEVKTKLLELADIAKYSETVGKGTVADIENKILQTLSGEITEVTVTSAIKLLAKRNAIIKAG